MTISSLHGRWIAIVVRAGQEIAVQRILSAHGYEVLVPLHANCDDCVPPCNGRPLFPGYCLLRFDSQNRWNVVRTPGVSKIVGFGDVVPCLPEHEIANLQILTESKRCKRALLSHQEGAPVRIVKGPLSGINALVSRLENSRRLIVQAPFFNRSISVALNNDDIVIDM